MANGFPGGLTLCDLNTVAENLRFWLTYEAPDRVVETASSSADTTLSDFVGAISSRQESVSLYTTLSDSPDISTSREETFSLDTTLSDIEMDVDADFSNCDMDIGAYFAGNKNCGMFVQTVEHLVKIKHGARVDGQAEVADGAKAGANQGPAGGKLA